jgi:hypothetical protein
MLLCMTTRGITMLLEGNVHLADISQSRGRGWRTATMPKFCYKTLASAELPASRVDSAVI